MRDTPYAKELASAEVHDCRIERIHVKAEEQDEIRFSWWPDGNMANRPLDLPEPMLLDLKLSVRRCFPDHSWKGSRGFWPNTPVIRKRREN